MVNAQEWLEKYFPKNTPKIEATPGKEKIGDLIIRDYPELKAIVIDRAKSLSKLLVINCPKVEWIIVSGSKISEININDCSNLTMLYCDENALKRIDLSGNPQLKELNCDKNPLEEVVGLEVETLTNLSYIRFPDEFKIMPNLSITKITKVESKLGKSLDEIINNSDNILGNKKLSDIPSDKNLEKLFEEIENLKETEKKLKGELVNLNDKYEQEKEQWNKNNEMLKKSQGISEGVKKYLQINTDEEEKIEEVIEMLPKTPKKT